MLTLLWSEGLFVSFYYRDELLAALNIFFTFGVLVWWLFGIGLVIDIFQRKDRWALTCLAALIIGSIRVCFIDQSARNAERWQAHSASLAARLPNFLNVPLSHGIRSRSGAYVFPRDVHVAEDKDGKRHVAFVQYRVGGDNRLAYVYDPSDSLTAGEKDYLFGFGLLGQVDSLGNHWYRCYFT